MLLTGMTATRVLAAADLHPPGSVRTAALMLPALVLLVVIVLLLCCGALVRVLLGGSWS